MQQGPVSIQLTIWCKRKQPGQIDLSRKHGVTPLIYKGLLSADGDSRLFCLQNNWRRRAGEKSEVHINYLYVCKI